MKIKNALNNCNLVPINFAEFMKDKGKGHEIFSYYHEEKKVYIC